MNWIEKGWGKPEWNLNRDLKYRSKILSDIEGVLYSKNSLIVEAFSSRSPARTVIVSLDSVDKRKIVVTWTAPSAGAPIRYHIYAQSSDKQQTFLKKLLVTATSSLRATINNLTNFV
jgi:fibronectin type 3 domain-containing protein